MECIPVSIRADQKQYDSFVEFILKITALDMSLVIEAYHVDEVSHLQHTVESVRDEGQILRRQVITDSLTSLSSRVFSFRSITTALRDLHTDAPLPSQRIAYAVAPLDQISIECRPRTQTLVFLALTIKQSRAFGMLIALTVRGEYIAVAAIC